MKKRPWTQRRPQSLQEFIAGEGGIRDDGGELAARGVNTRSSMTLNGPWAKKAGEQAGGGMFGGTSKRQGKGLAPDEMRRRLVEAGFMRDTPFEGGTARTTTDDMYALIDRALSGERIISEADMSWQAELDMKAKGKQADADWIAPFEQEFGKDARIAAAHGEDFAREAIKARKAGVKWANEDLQWADDFAKDTGETVRVSLDEAIYRRMLRQEEAAREADLAPPPDFDDAINSLR